MERRVNIEAKYHPTQDTLVVNLSKLKTKEQLEGVGPAGDFEEVAECWPEVLDRNVTVWYSNGQIVSIEVRNSTIRLPHKEIA